MIRRFITLLGLLPIVSNPQYKGCAQVKPVSVMLDAIIEPNAVSTMIVYPILIQGFA
jgi:hypothetical protein